MSCGNVAGTLTDVGACTGSASPYGSFDQGGNVYQWNEQMVAYPRDQHLVSTGSDRSLRGGSWSHYVYALAGASADLGSPDDQGQLHRLSCHEYLCQWTTHCQCTGT